GAGLGGAIFNNGGSVTIINSTLTGNLAQGGPGGTGATINGATASPDGKVGGGAGGAVFSRNGSLTITNSTFYLNTNSPIEVISDGAAATVTMNNTIVSNDEPFGFPFSDFIARGINGGSLNLGGGGNLIQVNFGFPDAGIVSSHSPQLGPLANHGGPTQTFAPAATSPALGAGL